VAGLDLDLRDPFAHLGRDAVPGRLGVAGERLGQQADRRERRPELVREVVDELGPDLLQPSELRDVLEDDPDTASRRRPGPDHDDRAVAPPSRNSPDAPPLATAVEITFSTRLSTKASTVDRPRSEPAGRGGGCGRRVRELDSPRSSIRTIPMPIRSRDTTRSDLLVQLQLGRVEALP
jgi:hypothetical protein